MSLFCRPMSVSAVQFRNSGIRPALSEIWSVTTEKAKHHLRQADHPTVRSVKGARHRNLRGLIRSPAWAQTEYEEPRCPLSPRAAISQGCEPSHPCCGFIAIADLHPCVAFLPNPPKCPETRAYRLSPGAQNLGRAHPPPADRPRPPPTRCSQTDRLLRQFGDQLGEEASPAQGGPDPGHHRVPRLCPDRARGVVAGTPCQGSAGIGVFP